MRSTISLQILENTASTVVKWGAEAAGNTLKQCALQAHARHSRTYSRMLQSYFMIFKPRHFAPWLKLCFPVLSIEAVLRMPQELFRITHLSLINCCLADSDPSDLEHGVVSSINTFGSPLVTRVVLL